MPVIKIGEHEIGRELRARERRQPKVMKRAMVRAARHGRTLLARRTPKDLGQAKAGWRISTPIKGKTRAAVDLYNDVPYVGILEHGARPHPVNLEGRVAIQEWVRRHYRILQHEGGPKRGKKREQAILDITNAIIWKLRTRGQKPRYFVKRSIPELQEFFAKEVDRQIQKESRRRASRKGPK